jgi:lysophospholipase L1-like esterase
MVIGALVGLGLAHTLGDRLAAKAAARFATPGPLDPDGLVWHVISPGMNENVVTPDLGRGTHVVGGALTVTQHVFYRPDTLLLRTDRPVNRIDLTLAPDSGVVRLVLRPTDNQAGRASFLHLHPDGFTGNALQNRWIETDGTGTYTLLMGDQASLQTPGAQAGLGSIPPGQLELSPAQGTTRIQALRALDEEGRILRDLDFSVQNTTGMKAVGAGLGMAVGAAIWVALQSSVPVAGVGLLGLVCLALPLLICFTSPDTWLQVVERLYLTKTPSWELARWALGLSLLPITALALAGSGLLRLPAESGTKRTPHDRAALGLWVLFAASATVLALRAQPAPAGINIGLGIVLLGLPVWPAWRAGLHQPGWLGRDLPALLFVAVLGWSVGLAAAVLWRLTVTAASLRTFLDRHARAGADYLFVLLLALPLTLEGAVRSSYLAEAWDPSKLSLETVPDLGWKDPVPSWTGSCGDQTDPLHLTFAGGSSTGGAYQFRDEPEAFFPAQAHALLCAQLGGGGGLVTTNYGSGNRDSHTISRTVDQLIDDSSADLLVLYVGVNDVLTHNNSLTRKQREAARAERSQAVRGLAGLARKSRLVSGAGLLLRTVPDPYTDSVPDVPLEDAEENFGMITEAAAERNVQVLLLTEYVSPDLARADNALSQEIVRYAEIQQRGAESSPHVHYQDIASTLDTVPAQDLLVDRNHLSRQGNRLLAEAIAPTLTRLLGLPAQPSTPDSD